MGMEGKPKEEVEREISTAMRARVSDFKDEADSLTLEGVRRVLEKDLGMKTFSLDVHKKFIKQCLEKYFYNTNDLDAPKSSEENSEKPASLNSGCEKMQQNNLEASNKLENPASATKQEELPPLPGKEVANQNAKSSEGIENDNEIGEEIIATAIKRRATHFRNNSTTITMAGVRQLLEEDLKLPKKALDFHKNFIRKQLEEVLTTTELVEPRKKDKKSNEKKVMPCTNKRKGNKESSEKKRESDNFEELSYRSQSCSDSDEINAGEAKPRKRSVKEMETKASEVSKRQKISAKNRKQSICDRKKQAEKITSFESNEGNGFEDDHSHSSVEEAPKKKREIQALSSYGKQVETLKSIIKSCGMGVPPSVYKKVKQAPESEREAFLIRELEGILEREGMSRNPSEKEIKLVRKQKERARELEGIDMSNIVSSSRRRTSTSYVPPKPQTPVSSESEEEEEEEEEDNNEKDSNGGVSSEDSEEEDEESD